MVLAAYPSITPEEFQQACKAFEARCVDRQGLDGTDWLMVRWTSEELRIKQRRRKRKGFKEDEVIVDPVAASAVADDDHDEEIIQSAAQMADLDLDLDLEEIDFSITYSLTYSVPVLWFWSTHLSTNEDVCGIVPEHLDEAVHSVGVMGGISRAYHPVTDMPAFFIHPCNTHSAMQAVRDDEDGARLSQEDYLLIWLGLTGSSVGLHVPSHLLTPGINSAARTLTTA